MSHRRKNKHQSRHRIHAIKPANLSPQPLPIAVLEAPVAEAELQKPKEIRGLRQSLPRPKHTAPPERHSQQSHRRAAERAAEQGHASEKEQHAHDRSIIVAAQDERTATQLKQQQETQNKRTATQKASAQEAAGE